MSDKMCETLRLFIDKPGNSAIFPRYRDEMRYFIQSTILNPRLCVLATAGPPRLESDISHSYPFKQNVKVPDDNARKINQAC